MDRKLDASSRQSSPPTNIHFAFIAAWACALQGAGNLGDSLHTLMKLLRADSAMLVRSQKRDNISRTIAKRDAEPGRFLQSDGAHSLANLILDKMLFVARPGSIWTLSDAEHARSTALPMSIREGVVIILERDGSQVDHLEIRFRSHPNPEKLDLLANLAGTLAKCWSGRKSCLIKSYLERSGIRPLADHNREQFVDILDPSNPSKLSRCEFRVCLFLKGGLRAKSIASELSVCEATIRSHLSAIYSKLGVNGQFELLNRMNGNTEHRNTKFQLVAG